MFFGVACSSFLQVFSFAAINLKAQGPRSLAAFPLTGTDPKGTKARGVKT